MSPRPVTCVAGGCLILALAIGASTAPSASVDADTVVQRWMQQSHKDLNAALEFGYRERVRDDDGTKTYEVTLLDGSPFKHLISIDGRTLDTNEAAKEKQRFADAKSRRDGESAEDRAERIARYKKNFDRGRKILEQMPKAFTYSVQGTQKTAGYTAYVLHAAPRPGYDPPSTDAEVLTGMQGQFWIDTRSYQLIRAVVRVVTPVTIDGFLATVQPGTEFEVEQKPVAPNVWLPTHFQIRSRSRVIYFFHHHDDEDRTFSDYRHES